MNNGTIKTDDCYNVKNKNKTWQLGKDCPNCIDAGVGVCYTFGVT